MNFPVAPFTRVHRLSSELVTLLCGGREAPYGFLRLTMGDTSVLSKADILIVSYGLSVGLNVLICNDTC